MATFTGNNSGNSYSGTDNPDFIFGFGGSDTLAGGLGDDLIVLSPGGTPEPGPNSDGLNDTIDGGGGVDTLILYGDFEDATISYLGSPTATDLVLNQGGTVETIRGVEVVTFDDRVVRVVGAGGYATIQQAIDAAEPGETILIAPGVYTGNIVVDVEGLTILAADGAVLEGTFKSDNGITGDVDVALRTAVSYTGQAGAGLTIAADDVTIRGLKIDSYLYGVEVADGVDRLTLDGLTIEDTVNGIRKAEAADVTDLTIKGGRIAHSYIGVIFNKANSATEGFLTGLTIDGTTFEHLTEKGIYTETLSDGLITNITMTDVGEYGRGPAFGGTGANAGGFGAGIDINLKFGAYSDITISNFDFVNVGSSLGGGTAHPAGGAITIKARDDATSYNTNPASFDGAIVISNGTISGTSTAIRAGEPGKSVTDPAVQVSGVSVDGEDYDFDNVTQSLFQVQGSSSSEGLTVNPSATGKFEINGADGDDSLSGGGASDTLTGGAGDDQLSGGGGDDVIFADGGDTSIDGGAGVDTVYVDSVATALRVTNAELIKVGSPLTGTTWVVLDGMSIQDAVDAAAEGDTILIAPGDYTESTTGRAGHGGNPFGLYIDKAGLTLQGVTAAGVAITDASAVQATVVAGAQSNFGANHFIDEGGDGVSIIGLHLQAGPQTDNKLLEIWADNVTVRANNIETLDYEYAPGLFYRAAAIYLNGDGGLDGVEWISGYTIDGNILNEGIIVSNGVGEPGGDADGSITGNSFVDGYDSVTGAGRYDTLAFNGAIPAPGSWLLESNGLPTVSGNSIADDTAPILLRFADVSAATFPTAAETAAIVDGLTDADNTFAYVLNGSGEIDTFDREYDFNGGGTDVSAPNFYVVNSIGTLNLGQDAEADGVFGGKRIDMNAGDTIVVQSGSTSVDDTIVVSGLNVQANANSADLNLTLADGVASVTLVDYATGAGADVDVTGSADANVITGNSGDNALSGADGADILMGGGGKDKLVGGDGVDTAGYGEDAVIAYDDVKNVWTVTEDGTIEVLDGIELVRVGTETFALVDQDGAGFQSLQAALDNTPADGTVLVAAGTYTVGSTLQVARNVTIEGANVGVAGDGARGAETIINTVGAGQAFELADSGLTFKVDGVTLIATSVLDEGAGATISFVNSVFDLSGSQDNNFYLGYTGGYTFNFNDNVVTSTGYRETFALFGGGALNITGNSFTGAGTLADYVPNDDNFLPLILNIQGTGGLTTGGVVSGNSFSNIDIGVLLGGLLSDTSITDNTFDGAVRTVPGTGLGAGVLLFNPDYTGAISIDGNTFSDSDAGIRVSSFDVETGGAVPETLAGLNVGGEGNTFTGNGQAVANSAGGVLVLTDSLVDGVSYEIHATGGATNDSIDGGTGVDLLVGGGGADTLSGLAGADSVVAGAGDDAINAGEGDEIDGGEGLDTAYVATLELAQGLSVTNVERIVVEGAGPGGGDVFVVQEGMSIQDAIDGAQDGDTIIVSAGEYTEQLTIDGKTNLTIRAADGATVTVKAPASLEVNGVSSYYGDNVRAVIAVTNSTNVDLVGIDVDGSYAGDTTAGSNGDELSGVAYLLSSGDLDDVDVFNVGNSPAGELFGLQHGSNVFIDGFDAATDPVVTLTGVDVSNFQKTGMLIIGANVDIDGGSIAATVEANALIAQNGIQIGHSQGSISGMIITGIGYGGDVWTSSGILAYEPSGDLTLQGNQITGVDGTGSVGIDLSDVAAGRTVTVSGNTLTGLQYGIYAYTYDPSVGLNTAPDFSLDPATLNDNVFVGITINGVYFDPEGGPFSTSTNFLVEGSVFADELYGSDGADDLRGADGDDVLAGRDGSDTLRGGGGNDTLEGGAGDDSYQVRNLGDVVTEAANEGVDLVTVTTALGETLATNAYVLGANVENLTYAGSVGFSGEGNNLNNVITSGGGKDKLSGEGGDDQLIGGSESDTLSGGAGNDTMNGGAGNDRYTVDVVGDVIVDSGGKDSLYSETLSLDLSSTAYAGLEDAFLRGGRDLNLTGDRSANELKGNAGDNRIFGGAGGDNLGGGAGRDVFDYDNVKESGAGRNNRDVIVDFTVGEDLIDLFNIDARPSTSQNNAFAFIEGPAFTGEGQIRVTASGGDTLVLINTDTNLNTAEMEILLKGPVALTDADFIL